MRYPDLLDAVKASQVKVDRLRRIAVSSPAETAHQAIRAQGSRQYVVGHVKEAASLGGVGAEIVLELEVSAYGARIGLCAEPWNAIYSLDAATLACAAHAARTIERWIAGEIDELPPSGRWVTYNRNDIAGEGGTVTP